MQIEPVQDTPFARRQLTADLKAYARSLGFDIVGITPAEAWPDTERQIVAAIDEGLLDVFSWFTEERARFSCDPRNLQASAHSVISLAICYLSDGPVDLSEPGRPHGQVARYAWGRDYHDVLKEKMAQLVAYIRAHPLLPSNLEPEGRLLVDTARIVDRAAAERAGVGWYGKNTNIITWRHGTWILLSELLLNIELEYDEPLKRDCGRCTICIDACPTGAIIEPYKIDSSRCISYLTIELRGPIPRDLRPKMGNMIFGCDICQSTCPHNKRVQAVDHPEFVPRKHHLMNEDGSEIEDPQSSPALLPLLHIGEEEFRQRFRGTPLTRPKRHGIRRNVAVALGNLGDPVAIPYLAQALADRSDPSEAATIVRGHAAWALGRIGGTEARTALEQTLSGEDEPSVREEIELALVEMNCGD